MDAEQRPRPRSTRPRDRATGPQVGPSILFTTVNRNPGQLPSSGHGARWSASAPPRWWIWNAPLSHREPFRCDSGTFFPSLPVMNPARPLPPTPSVSHRESLPAVCIAAPRRPRNTVHSHLDPRKQCHDNDQNDRLLNGRLRHPDPLRVSRKYCYFRPRQHTALLGRFSTAPTNPNSCAPCTEQGAAHMAQRPSPRVG